MGAGLMVQSVLTWMSAAALNVSALGAREILAETKLSTGDWAVRGGGNA